ncbi:substrate-binding domain-containing protein [Methylocapsa sp. S129]|uniref:substrate-binding domain-containing protein n=1 Tax=Methylocapsa sp. S129 TaxID=1641869 RepID=UPI00131C885E|nr:substrate-binding domain-containing protein [Methylocapsa sp. S129]
MIAFRKGLAGLALLAAFAGPALAAGIPGAPAPFDKGGVRVALVSYLSQGDYFEAYEAGVARQAKALGIDLRIFQGKQDAAQQREQIEQAISLGVSGIIVSHGQPEALKDVIQKALDAGIKVVVKDVDIGNPKVPLISQSDHDIAEQALGQALKDNGKSFPAGYVFVAGFRPLELRGEVWATVKKANPGIVEKAQWGAVDSNTATTVANQTAAALRANPDIKVVFAPYDEFARGVKLGATEAGVADKIKIYSADVSTSDILDIREPGSPWVATSATNPAVVGEVSLRALALLIAGQDPGKVIEVKPFLITQADLIKNDIKKIGDLDAKLPGFGHSDQATAPWLQGPANTQ